MILDSHMTIYERTTELYVALSYKKQLDEQFINFTKKHVKLARCIQLIITVFHNPKEDAYWILELKILKIMTSGALRFVK